MQGNFGRYLDVDLSERKIEDYEIPIRWYPLHLGGRGIAARILVEELKGEEDALSAENILVFATGPFQGTGIVGAGRHVVMGISPKTNSICDSYCGGYFGHELGRSGYDGIIIRGVASGPVYLSLIDGEADIHSAAELWGNGTGDTVERLSKRYPQARVATIGPAGENLVQMSCIIHDGTRAAGRPGLGAVMGAKRLKAIVVRGHEGKPIHDPKRLKQERSQYVRGFIGDEMKDFGKYGTAGGVVSLSEQGILPTKNFQEGSFALAENISGERMHDTILVGRESCAGCPIRCKRVVETSFNGREVFTRFGGPEYETLAAFGSLCLNDDLDSIALANQLCNDYGIDTISAGVAISFLMEASEHGLLDDPIRWGDGEAIVGLVDKIANRQGIGEQVASGLEFLATQLGAEFNMTIKGVEIPMHEPRGKQGLGISYSTSPRGATHMEANHDTGFEVNPELGVEGDYDRFTLADKPRVVKIQEDLRSFDNSLILCAFTSRSSDDRYRYPHIRSLLAAVTGQEFSPREMLSVGERNYALLRLHSARCGHTVEQDGLPRRFNEPLPSGASAGRPIKAETLDKAIEDYYRERGYDRFGPTDETLRRLGLEACVGLIERR
jgi:aldehyde:ferredoxin oxidoreductase